MRSAVIYYSRWGNCKQLAKAIAAGLSASDNMVYTTDVTAVAQVDPAIDCLILGSPTSMGRASRQIRRFIKQSIPELSRGKAFVAFGTGLDVEIEMGHSQAAEEIHEMLIEKGLKPLSPPFMAAVSSMRGPLAEGELERALQFGRQLGRAGPFEIRPVTRPRLKRVV
jgi:menaquinone-dependent protoporphyrinogen IX oxidase